MKILAFALTAVVVLVGAALSYIYFDNHSAETRARKFCEEIPMGSDISLAIKSADAQGIRHEAMQQDHRGQHSFYYPGFTLDQAVCIISAGEDGRVLGSHSDMRYDIR